jgi:glycosyltransferase involved in cell wall biosynthesis
MMRLCFVTSEYITESEASGGLASYLAGITSALSQRGHHVHVITRATSNGTIIHEGVTVHRVVPLWDRRMILDHVDPLIPRIFYNPYQDFKAAWCLWRCWNALHRLHNFDLVQVTNVMSTGLFFRFEKSVPVVTRLSSYRPFWDTAAGIPITAGVRLRWAMERAAVTGTRYVYAPSNFVSALVEKKYQISPVKIIESPFNLEAVGLDNLNQSKIIFEKPFALFFGQMTQMKGVHVIVYALKTVMKKFPDFRMIFIGPDGIAPDGSSMKEFIARSLSEFQDRIEILEPLRRSELYPIVRKARLVVLPSLFDNLPNSCIEAMGLNRAVIATSGSCFEQLIENNHSGYLVAPNDDEALACKISDVWQLTDDEIARVGSKAQERISHLSPDFVIPRLIDYYSTIQRNFQPNSQCTSP